MAYRNPHVGDIRHNYPPGTSIEKITEFEVWNGITWIATTLEVCELFDCNGRLAAFKRG